MSQSFIFHNVRSLNSNFNYLNTNRCSVFLYQMPQRVSEKVGGACANAQYARYSLQSIPTAQRSIHYRAKVEFGKIHARRVVLPLRQWEVMTLI